MIKTAGARTRYGRYGLRRTRFFDQIFFYISKRVLRGILSFVSQRRLKCNHNNFIWERDERKHIKNVTKAFYFLNMMSSKNKIKDKLLEISVQCFWSTIWRCYSSLSLSWTHKGPANLFEIERVRDRERKIGYNLHKGIETLVRHRERFEIEGVRDRESQV